MVEYKTIEKEVWKLTEEGAQIASDGSHEVRVFEAIAAGPEGSSVAEISVYLLCMI